MIPWQINLNDVIAFALVIFEDQPQDRTLRLAPPSLRWQFNVVMINILNIDLAHSAALWELGPHWPRQGRPAQLQLASLPPADKLAATVTVAAIGSSEVHWHHLKSELQVQFEVEVLEGRGRPGQANSSVSSRALVSKPESLEGVRVTPATRSQSRYAMDRDSGSRRPGPLGHVGPKVTEESESVMA